MVDPRISKYLEMARAMREGQFRVEMQTIGDDEVGQLGRELVKLGDALERKFQEMTKLLKVTRDDFFQVIRNEPALATKLLWSFLQVLSDRLRATSQELSDAREDVEDLSIELFDLEPVDTLK